jgi:dienelactone hydrolase
MKGEPERRLLLPELPPAYPLALGHCMGGEMLLALTADDATAAVPAWHDMVTG